MPIYEYACKNCDHTLDALQKMSDESLVDCPQCGEAQLRKLISAPRFRLKGAGWYETDFKKDNQRNLVKNDSESTKSESKPDSADKSSDSAKPDKTDAPAKAEKPKAEEKPKSKSKVPSEN